MNKFGCLITVRTNSSRLPKKCLLPFGNMNVLEHNIKRASKAGLNPIVCTSINQNDDAIIEICKIHNTPFFRGSELNKILRWYECMKFYELELIHTIDSDDPFFCPYEIMKSIDLACKTINIPTVVYPSKASMNGAASVGFSFNQPALSKILENVSEECDTEMIESFIENTKNLNKFFLEGEDINKDIHRLTLDYAEDYLFLLCIKSALGTYASREQINEFINKFPQSKKINESREIDWMKNQNRSSRY
tara:strand:- start:192 stop:938 length:747 start_codon:yes stop_codon:yes gene_type:complete